MRLWVLRSKQTPQGGLAPTPASPNYTLCQFPFCDVGWQSCPCVQIPNAGNSPTCFSSSLCQAGALVKKQLNNDSIHTSTFKYLSFVGLKLPILALCCCKSGHFIYIQVTIWFVFKSVLFNSLATCRSIFIVKDTFTQPLHWSRYCYFTFCVTIHHTVINLNGHFSDVDLIYDQIDTTLNMQFALIYHEIKSN